LMMMMMMGRKTRKKRGRREIAERKACSRPPPPAHETLKTHLYYPQPLSSSSSSSSSLTHLFHVLSTNLLLQKTQLLPSSTHETPNSHPPKPSTHNLEHTRTQTTTHLRRARGKQGLGFRFYLRRARRKQGAPGQHGPLGRHSRALCAQLLPARGGAHAGARPGIQHPEGRTQGTPPWLQRRACAADGGGGGGARRALLLRGGNACQESTDVGARYEPRAEEQRGLGVRARRCRSTGIPPHHVPLKGRFPPAPYTESISFGCRMRRTRAAPAGVSKGLELRVQGVGFGV